MARRDRRMTRTDIAGVNIAEVCCLALWFESGEIVSVVNDVGVGAGVGRTLNICVSDCVSSYSVYHWCARCRTLEELYSAFV